MILLALLALSAFAADPCDSLRLDNPGGSMEHVAVRDQGSFPNCYAEVAAQMTDAWRFTHGDVNFGFQSSGMIAAIEASRANGYPDFASSGAVIDAISAIKKNGSCDERAVLESVDPDLAVSVFKELRAISYLDPEPAARQIDRLYSDRSCSFVKDPLREILPDRSTLKAVFYLEDPWDRLSSILALACTKQNHLAASIPNAKLRIVGDVLTPEQRIRYVETRLSDIHDQPLAVNYCANVIQYQKDYTGLENGGLRTDCNVHISLIIGKTRNAEGKCQFIVRNTWGNECDRWNTWPCDGHGDYVIDADALARNTIAFTDFEGIAPAGFP